MGRSAVGSVGTDFHAQHWLSFDPCGLLCLSFSYALHLFALFASGFTLISHHLAAQLLYGTLYVPLACMSLWSLFAACTTNPGAVPMGARPLASNSNLGIPGGEDDSIIVERDYERGGLRRRRGIRRCAKCNDNYKPARAHHDSVTGRCVVKFDHYCPWVGNAVGIMNHKFFILFIFYTLLTAIVSLTLIIIRVIRCEYYTQQQPLGYPPSHYNSTTIISNDELPAGCNPDQFTIVFILGIITLLFFFFTFCMLIEQSEAISTNISKIARLKTRSGMVSNPDEYAPVSTEFNEVFGGEHPNVSWHWFVPLKVQFPHWAIDNVMGYDVCAAAMTTLGCSTPYQEPELERGGGSVTSAVAGVSTALMGEDAILSERDDSVGKFGLVEGAEEDVERGNVEVNTEQRNRQTPMRDQMKDDTTTLTSTNVESSGVKKRSAGSFIL